jgi:hypothetical protein
MKGKNNPTPYAQAFMAAYRTVNTMLTRNIVLCSRKDYNDYLINKMLALVIIVDEIGYDSEDNDRRNPLEKKGGGESGT